MFWLCAPRLFLLALFCWEHSEFKRPTTRPYRRSNCFAPERETSPVFVFVRQSFRDGMTKEIHAAALAGATLCGL
jgi:hypothetical protein